MTLDEKVSQLINTAPAIPRLNAFRNKTPFSDIEKSRYLHHSKAENAPETPAEVSCRFEGQNPVFLATACLSLEKPQPPVAVSWRHGTDLRTPSPASDRQELEPSILCGDSEADLC
jgi:hypothetical protein